eukprot:10605761-Karenia_brevis.AAC.1
MSKDSSSSPEVISFNAAISACEHVVQWRRIGWWEEWAVAECCKAGARSLLITSFWQWLIANPKHNGWRLVTQKLVASAPDSTPAGG